MNGVLELFIAVSGVITLVYVIMFPTLFELELDKALGYWLTMALLLITTLLGIIYKIGG